MQNHPPSSHTDTQTQTLTGELETTTILDFLFWSLIRAWSQWPCKRYYFALRTPASLSGLPCLRQKCVHVKQDYFVLPNRLGLTLFCGLGMETVVGNATARPCITRLGQTGECCEDMQIDVGPYHQVVKPF